MKTRPLVAELFYAGRHTEGQVNMKKRIAVFAIFGKRLQITKYLNNTVFWNMVLFSMIEICLPFEFPSLCTQGKQVVKFVLDYLTSNVKGTYLRLQKPQFS